MTNRKVRVGRATQCPQCLKIGSVKEILYGMPGDSFNFERYIVGGCLEPEDAPEVSCTACEWGGSRAELRLSTPEK